MILIYLLIGFGVGYWVAKAKYIKSGQSLNDTRHAEREAVLAKVLAMFSDDRPELSNNDIEEALGVSDATATNYLSALEQQGKITQIGREGRFVRYKLNG